MNIKIYKNPEITKENLIKEIRSKGYVVFSTTRTAQRNMAGDLIEYFENEDLSLIKAETKSYNYCMCVVDSDRHNYRDILDAAALEDKP